MKIKQMTVWELRYSIPSFGVFYAVLFTVYIAFFLMQFLLPEEAVVNFSGASFSSWVFLFVIGIIYCRECLQFGLANGVSRRSIFLSYLLTIGCFSAVMSVVTLLMRGFFGMITREGFIREPFDMLYGTMSNLFANFCFVFGIGLMAGMLGYLISMFNYRTGKAVKIITWGSFGALCFLLPILTMALNERVQKVIGDFFMTIGTFLANSPYHVLLTAVIATVIFGFAGWLFTRHAPVKSA